MKTVIQRVHKAYVEVEGSIVGQIDQGLIVFLGIAEKDTQDEAQWIIDKLLVMRIFSDTEGRMNLNVMDVGGSILVVSQFTLFGDLKKGTRPSFNRAAASEKAKAIYENFIESLSKKMGQPVATGCFGALMRVVVEGDGPVTLLLEKEAE